MGKWSFNNFYNLFKLNNHNYIKSKVFEFVCVCETVSMENAIHLFDSNEMWLHLNIPLKSFIFHMHLLNFLVDLVAILRFR